MKLITWKFPALYLSAVGIANIGGWVYLLAINLMVYEITGSALAVAGLYMIKPFAHMVVGLWVGSIIDRVSTKHLMITLDSVRAFLLLLIPFIESIWFIYIVVLFIQLAGAIFEPASFTYMTMLLPEKDRKRFNALLSFVHSGAFVLGPALAGVLFMVGSLEMALFLNVAVFILSAGLIFLLPTLVHSTATGNNRLTLQDIRADWRLVLSFSKIAFPFVVVYMAFQGVMLLTAALDSMEVSFAKEVLQLSNAAYGSLVSVAGIGFLIGAVCTNLIVRFTSDKQLMGSGTILLAVGYIIYSFSTTYVMASTGVFILSFSLSIANTGFITFIQKNIPIEMMGRISSLYSMIASSLEMLVILTLGFVTQWLPLQEVVIGGSFLMLMSACFLLITVISLYLKDFTIRLNYK